MFFEDSEFGAVQMRVTLVDLKRRCNMSIEFQKIHFDAADNEPSKVCQKGFTRYNYNARIPSLVPRYRYKSDILL